MKTILFLSLLIPSTGFAQNLTIYRCEYRIAKNDGKPLFTMSGNIVADDAAGAPNQATYLTLAPNQLSGDTTEARILITSDGYDPITLHQPGRSATTLASTELRDDGATLSYRAGNGTYYSVRCGRRQ
jgi:hypothetical protein